MSVGGELALGGERLERRAFPGGGIAVDVVDRLGLDDEEAAVDVADVLVRLLAEGADAVRSGHQVEHAETARRPYGGQGGQRAAAAMERELPGDVDVGDAVAIGETEGIAVEIGPDALDPPPRHRSLAGVDQRYTPGLEAVAMGFPRPVVQVAGDVGSTEEGRVGTEGGSPGE